MPDAQTTNIPSTAWRGTQIRFVKCSDDLVGIGRAGLDVAVEEWSGSADSRPTVFESSIAKINDRCARFNAVSLGEGLARIKLKAFEGPDRVEILEHQFLAIWMTLGVPTIDEVGANDPTGGPVGSETEVGDPAGDGMFVPSGNNGRVQVMVNGSFPHPLGPGGRFTLPTDWATIARALATEADPSSEMPWLRWDIHDDMTKAEGHVAGFCRDELHLLPWDAVDNCRGAREGVDPDYGPFSRLIGGMGDGVNGAEGQGAGPFDPQRSQSLLSDGNLNAGDAPMPAARVDIAIARNTGAAGDISGAGALEAADKTEVYSRDGNGTGSPHNLYAPYYKQWLPATSAEDVNPRASGTDWFVQNNFPGAPFGLYDNWETFPLGEPRAEIETGCNRTVAFPGGAEADDPRVTPTGDDRVAVFTDEHGEAQVEYRPYAGGFFYDAVGAVINDNRGCDLQDVDTLGTSAITATAKYPGQPVSAPAQPSATLTKTVGNEFDKSLSYYPKGAGTANANARILVAHGQDVDGEPFAGERVCFYVDDEADSYRLFSGTTGPAGMRFSVDTDQAPTPDILHPDVRCAYLDENGNAALEVFNSDPQSINVIAEYIDEGLLRDRDVEFGTAGSGDPEPPPGTPTDDGTTPPASGPGTTPPSGQQAVATMGPQAAARVVGATSTGKVKARVAKARIVRTKKGKVLKVKVISARSHERIAVKLVGRKGNTVAKRTKRVRTNRTVRVMKLSAKVKSVRVALKG